jgi:hypothetical protein
MLDGMRRNAIFIAFWTLLILLVTVMALGIWNRQTGMP